MNRTEASVRDTSQAGGNSAARAQEAPGAEDGRVGFGAFAARYQPKNFNGEDIGWRDWSRVFRTWAGRFQRGECKKILRSVDARPGDEATVAELDLRLEEWASAESKSVAADFHHALILFCNGKTLKNVLTNKEREGFEAWRALVNKYEPTSKVSVVGKLAKILRTPFDGDLLDATTTFERKIMIYEAQSRETISDSLKIGCVIAGMGQNSMREHLLMSATKCDSWTNFVREMESIEHAKKPSLHRHRWSLMHFKETVTTMEGQRSLNVHNAERNIKDSVGYGATHHPTKIHRKEDGKETEKETAREPRKVEGSKEEKAETMGKDKVEERKDNVSTKSQNHRKNSHIELSHSVSTPQHAKLLFLPITLTKTHYLDVRTALQAETKCVIKERGSCAPWMIQKANGHREQKSPLSTTLDGGHRDDRLWSMGLFWTTKARFQF